MVDRQSPCPWSDATYSSTLQMRADGRYLKCVRFCAIHLGKAPSRTRTGGHHPPPLTRHLGFTTRFWRRWSRTAFVSADRLPLSLSYRSGLRKKTKQNNQNKKKKKKQRKEGE